MTLKVVWKGASIRKALNLGSERWKFSSPVLGHTAAVHDQPVNATAPKHAWHCCTLRSVPTNSTGVWTRCVKYWETTFKNPQQFPHFFSLLCATGFLPRFATSPRHGVLATKWQFQSQSHRTLLGSSKAFIRSFSVGDQQSLFTPRWFSTF